MFIILKYGVSISKPCDFIRPTKQNQGGQQFGTSTFDDEVN